VSLSVVVELGGVALIALGAVVASVADELLFVVCALFLQFLGLALVTLIAVTPSAGVVTLLVGGSTLAILVGGAALRFGPNGRPAPRAFDLSVVALAIVGAIGLAVTHPLLPNVPVDVAIGVLVLTGLLFCLQGGAARVVCGLIFLTSGAGLLLQAAEPGLSESTRVLLAASQLALVIALSVAWTTAGDRDVRPPRRRRYRTRPLLDGSRDEPGQGGVPG